jgi:malto-oligosyltrehalose synthase
LSVSFTLDDLAARVPYLAQLGISHLYLSPIWASRPGSPHGYDVVDYGRIDDELGGPAAWERLEDAVRSNRLALILDVVPNHMAADPVNNPIWRQCLREGPSSAAARFFDIDWRPLTGLVRDKVVLPILEEPYGEALVRGRVRLECFGPELRVVYRSMHLPLSPASAERVREQASSCDSIAELINESPDRLHELLEEQHYRLAYWRPASDEINYRRFFGVNELVAIRAEDEAVFSRSHCLVRSLAAHDVVDGLRVDHVDGLLDPATYLERLRAEIDTASGRRPWIVVEKILNPRETLEHGWPVDGTTGYDALDVLNRLFVSGRGVRMLRRSFQHMVEDGRSFREKAYESKRLIMDSSLRSGMTMLAHELKRLADASWTTRDITLHAFQEALVEFFAELPVYRTYLRPDGGRIEERTVVEKSLESAARRNPAMDSSAFDFIGSLLLGQMPSDDALAPRRARVVAKLQQYTSGVQAKGVEDTAFYRDAALIALNEVGGNPGAFSLSVRDFHRFNEQRLMHWPHSMTATSTHDTKLSEDARFRIGALSMFPREWIEAVRRWRSLNAPQRHECPSGSCPDALDEYRFYQVVVGVWNERDFEEHGQPTAELVERLVAYARKSAREAKLRTSWMRPDGDYERRLEAFVRGTLTGHESFDFRRSMNDLVRLLEPVAMCHSVSQLVLKCGMPGVPDFYQGAEDWTFNLTDPDNRRAVDFSALSQRLVRRVERSGAGPACRSEIKLLATAALLRFRRCHAALFQSGDYVPLRVRGVRAPSVVAFERRDSTSSLVIAVPRLNVRSRRPGEWPSGRTFWGDTEIRLPESRAWTNVLTGGRLKWEGAWAAMGELTGDQPWVVIHADNDPRASS